MLNKIVNKIQRKRHEFIEGYTGDFEPSSKKVLLYYKTDPLYQKRLIKKYTHTNFWEISEIVRILNQYGFTVDIIDRTAVNFIPEDIYDIFIGIGAGNSGKHYARYASVLKKAVKILYAAGPDPKLSNDLVVERYNEFYERTGYKAPYMRGNEIDFPKFMEFTDVLFCFGEAFSYETYKKYNKPIYSIMPSASPKIRFSTEFFNTRKTNKFLCFAGDGFICKGVDILVEAFLKTPDADLHICGPNTEKSFFEVYGESIEKAPNIFFHGFVIVGSPLFQELCSKCSFVIFNSAAEAAATSVTTAMRAGLVPVLNYETSINIDGFGFLMQDNKNRIQDIINIVKQVLSISKEEYRARVYATLKDSLNYTQAAFTQSFSNALIDVIEKHKV